MESVAEDRSLPELEKRVRELRCLYRVSALMSEQGVALEEQLQQAVVLLPAAYHYPAIACARLLFGDAVFQTAGFRQTEWEQTAPVATFTSRIGALQVCYLEQRPDRDEGPFLIEERELLNTVADLLGDLVERKRTAEMLRLHEDRLYMVLNSAPLILWAVDRDGIITLSRGKMLGPLGFKPGELVGRPIESILADRPRFRRCVERALAGEDVSEQLEWGGFFFDSRFTPIRTADGGIDGVIGVSVDISERMKAEDMLRETNALLEEIFASANFLIASLDRDFRYIRVNDAYARSRGHTPEYYLGKNFFDLFPRMEYLPVLRSVLETGEPVSVRDRPYQSREHPERDPTYWDIEVLPMRRGGPSVEGLILILVDRSRRNRALQELDTSRRELRSLASHLQDLREEERKTIAREVHDELGGFLTALKMDLSLLESGLGTGAERPSALASAEDLVNQALSLARRIATDLRPRLLDDFGLVPAIEWQIAEFRRRARVRCDLEVSPEDLGVGRDLALSIYRILQESLTNVARHSGASRVKVRLAVDAGAISLVVSDNGKGIEAARGDGPASFGLIGMRERAAHFRGTVQVEGTPGKGTTIAVSIPLPVEERPPC